MGKNTLAPGFRFHPTDLELVMYYLKRKVLGKKFSVNAPIAEVDIYKNAPWDLPGKSCLKTGDLKWYFFCPMAKKYGKGGRLNRATVYGYWKTTGKDRPVEHNGEVVGMRKTLVFHRGKAPSGERTDWVMHEYKLEEKKLADKGIFQDSYVLCEVFEKEGMGPRNGAQYGAPFKEEDWSDDEEETTLPGTGSLRGMSVVVVGGANSSPVPESLCVGPSVESSGLYTPPLVDVTSDIDCSAYAAPTVDAYEAPMIPAGAETVVGPSIESSGLYTLSPINVTSAIDSTAYAPPTFVDTHPEVPLVADAETVPAFLEAQVAQFVRDEEPNGNILTLLDSFHADDAFLPYDGDQTKVPQSSLPYDGNQMRVPQVSHEDNDVVLMLESFTEVDDPSNWSCTF